MLPRTATTRQASPEVFDLLRRTDTCTISNAIETLNVRMRNEGFVHGPTHSLFPELPPVAGYAVTATMRATAPPISGDYYYHRLDWWRYVAQMPGPKVLVIEDLDRAPGVGALIGEIHAQIARALGCVGALTNGTVRDLGPLRTLGFPCFALGAGVSHSYAHITEFGVPVYIGGLKISSGDLLQGDRNGIHEVPFAVADRLAATVAGINRREAELIALCMQPDFTIQKLENALR
jgi:4-hydroxy-4-methyl-2-oxoglutarate aldolase